MLQKSQTMAVMAALLMSTAVHAETRRCPICEPPNLTRQFNDSTALPAGNHVPGSSGVALNNGSAFSASDIRSASQRSEYTGGGRNDFTRGQNYTQGTYFDGHSTSTVTVRASQGDIGSVHAVSGGPFKGKTTAHQDGSFHHHDNHMAGRDNEFSNRQ